MDDDWDITKYKYDSDLNHHWELKKRFMEAHKNEYPERRLACLAQIFCNVHYLGCTYSETVMELVKNLAVGVIPDDQPWDKAMHKIGFASASGAIADKVKVRLAGQSSSSHSSGTNNIDLSKRFVHGGHLGREGQLAHHPDAGKQVPYSGEQYPPAGQPHSNPEPSSSSSNHPVGGGPSPFIHPKDVPFNKTYSDPRNLSSSDGLPSDSGSQFVYSNNRKRERPDGGYWVSNSPQGNYRQNLDFNGPPNKQNYWAQLPNPKKSKKKKGKKKEVEETVSQVPLTVNQVNDLEVKKKKASTEHYSSLISTKLSCVNPYVGDFLNQRVSAKKAREYIDKVVGSGTLGKLVVFEHGTLGETAVTILEQAVGASDVSRTYVFDHKDNRSFCRLTLDGMFIAQGEGETKVIAKIEASRLGLARLREICFFIQVKANYVSSSTIGKSLVKEGQEEQQEPSLEKSGMDTPLSHDNIGNKMMKSMGWSGGGLGKNQQGIAEPIKPHEDYNTITKGGLGSEGNSREFRFKVMNLLRDFKDSKTDEDLVFSPEFSKEERAAIHEFVRKFGLKSRSIGKEDVDRRIIISKRMTPLKLVKELLMKGGETAKYKLLHPLCAE